MFYVHYDKATGRILSKLSGSGVLVAEDMLQIDSFDDVDPAKHKVDVVTLEVIPIPPEDLPFPVEEFTIKALVFQELQSSDFTQLPDSKFSDIQRKEWREYRKKLRDISKLPGPEAMLAAWPLRPDGGYAAAHLKLLVE